MEAVRQVAGITRKTGYTTHEAAPCFRSYSQLRVGFSDAATTTLHLGAKMVGFLGDDEVREVWRMRDGHRPVLSRAAQARVDPGGGHGQMLRSAPPLRLRPLWGTSVYMQNPTHWREMQRQLRENEPQGTAISHAELLKVPRSRLHYLMRPGLAEAAEAKNQRHAAWRDDPMRDLCREQAYRCQLRAAQSLPPLAARSGLPQRMQVRDQHMDSVAPGPELAGHSERMHPHGETRSPKLSRRREHVLRALAAETARPSRGRTQVRVLRPGDRTPPPAEEEEEEAAEEEAAEEEAAEEEAAEEAVERAVKGATTGVTFTFSSSVGVASFSEVDLSAPALTAALTTATNDHAASGGHGGFGISGGAGGAGGGSMLQPAPSAMTGQPNWCGTRALDSSVVSLPPLSGGSVGGRAQPSLPPGR